MEKKLRAGVLGLRMGDAHCIGYRNNPYCELVARDPETGVRLYKVVNRRAGPIRRQTTPQ